MDRDTQKFAAGLALIVAGAALVVIGRLDENPSLFIGSARVSTGQTHFDSGPSCTIGNPPVGAPGSAFPSGAAVALSGDCPSLICRNQ